MPRRRRQQPANPAADALDDLVGTARPAKKKRAMTSARLAQAVEKVVTRIRDNNWDDLRPSDLVAAHAWCHGETYGVADGDLLGDGWSSACIAAGNAIHREFADDAEEALAFLRWAWSREQRREQKRKQDGGAEGRRLTWVLIFRTKHVLTDYRVERGRELERTR